MPTGVESSVTPLGLGLTAVMAVLMLLLPRRYAIVPLIFLTCFMTLGQVLMIVGLHFPMIRVIVLFGWIRLLVRREMHSIRFNEIDRVLLWWIVSNVVANTILWRTSEAVVNRMGFAYNAIGLYFLCRFLVRSLDDVRRVFTFTAILILPLAVAMLIENMTARNLFSVFGGVPDITVIRQGVLRCQGPFAHPILAGTFGASLIAYFVGLWWQGPDKRLLAALAIIASTTIVITSGSSGPVISYAAAILGLAMWGLRKHMRMIRWGVALGLIGLHLVMKAPVWFLIARIDIFAASTGYHRALLIDKAVANFGGWWLIGTKSVAQWSEFLANPATPNGDITNAYIMQGVDGGVLTLILFVTVMVRCFRGVGRAIATFKDAPPSTQRCAWALGAALFTHAVTFMSISYFDQNYVNWYLLLAMISTVTDVAFISRQRVHAAASILRNGAQLQAATA